MTAHIFLLFLEQLKNCENSRARIYVCARTCVLCAYVHACVRGGAVVFIRSQNEVNLNFIHVSEFSSGGLLVD